MLDVIRRAIGLHVHDWEEVAGESHRDPSSAQFVQPGWRPWDLAPLPASGDVKTFKCRTCDRTRTSRVQVG